MAVTRGAVETRLRDVPFFSALPEAPLRTIAGRLKRRRYKPGDTVFREGDPADTLFLVESGRVHVWTSDNGQLLASLGPGSILGEIALLLDVPRTATVRAVTACSMLVLSRRSLNELVRKYPSISAELTRELGRRLRSTSRHVERGRAQQSVAIWGPGAARLAAAVRSASKTTPAILAIAGSPPEDRDRSRAKWIDASDVDFNALVLHGLRVDDHELLFIALSTKPSRQNELALDVADQIVTFEPAPDWVRERAAGRPLIDASTPAMLERAVRWVTGRSVGLVLSSGGSRTIAHIGVVQVLRERGIPIDAVSGSSGGAAMAAMVAAGIPFDQMVEYTRDFAKLMRFRRMDLNLRMRGSLLKGREIHRTFKSWVQGRESFDDLEIPLYVASTDLLTGEEVVLSSGSVSDAIRASISIPGVIEPWPVNGRILTDGAVVDPLPATVLKAAGVHRLVASNVAGIGTVTEDVDAVTSLGLLGMVNRVNALREQQIIGRQMSLVDGVIRPRVYAASALDFRQIDQFVEAGAAAARLQLPEFEKRLTSAARPGR
jgi:NTE family protein